MSAIAGIYNLNNEEPVAIEHINGMMKALEKFPADDIQVWQKGSVFLGCHAQWITPESIGEQLPFYDSERKCAITADCIIDNREELFEALQVPRDDQKTIPDSLLILLAYYKWGEDCPKHLIGDFAFMIWDERERKLFGARDFSGSRTLYYFNNGKQFGFCTVMKPLFRLPSINKELNEDWLAEFLAIPVTVDSINSYATVYSDIKQIPPSHSISLKGREVKFEQYHSLSFVESLHFKSNAEYEEGFLEIFGKAVKNRLRTRLNVGAHLSGGLDSGSVVSIAAKELIHQEKKLHTFSYVPVDDFLDWTPKHRIADERPLIKATVQHVGNISDHYSNFKELSPLSEINKWLETMEMPYKFFENSFWLKGIYELAQKEKVGVLLNGQRGNWTISWGPTIDYYAILLKRFNWIHLLREINLFSKNMGVKKSRIFKFIGMKTFPELYNLLNQKELEAFPILINQDFAKKTEIFKRFEKSGIDFDFSANAFEIRKKQFEQLFYWNLNGTIGTKLSLQHSLWERDPTNDLRVIKYCLSLPDSQFVQSGQDRSLIRRATKDLLPDSIRLNQKIRGVQGADGVHRMRDCWSDLINESTQLTKDALVSRYLDTNKIKSIIDKVRVGPKPELVFDLDFRILMRGLIFSRFINQNF